MEETFQGIVVREAPQGESGKLLWVLTPDKGVVHIFATGARRLSASYLKSVQLFAYSKLTVYEKNGRMTLTEAELIESFYYIRKDLIALAFASYACEMAAITAVPEDSSTIRLLLNTLYAVANEVSPIPLIKAVFELKLCCISGLMPDLEDSCPQCGSPSEGFNVIDMEPRCHIHKGSGDGYVSLCAAAKKIAAYVCSTDFSRMLSFRASPDAAADFCIFSEAFAIAALGVNPKTLQFYNGISRKQL